MCQLKITSGNQVGFTLVELLVTLAVSGLLLTAVTQLFISSNKVHTVQEQVLRIQQGVRAGLDIMARDIRMAGYDPTGSASAAGFTTANATNLRVQYDYDDDGSCDKDRDYEYDASERVLEVQRGGAGGFQDLVKNIDSLNFQYTLANGATTSNPADTEDIRRVNINICGRISGGYSETYDNTYCFSNVITCRNMGM